MTEHGEGRTIPTANALVRREVRALLALSPAYEALPPETRSQVANDTITIGVYLAEPEGYRANHLRGAVAAVAAAGTRDLLDEVNFPDFVAGLIQGVFHAIVEASIEQMQAYGDLVKSVADSARQFAADHLSDAKGRDWLATTYPEYFERDPGCDALRLRPGVDAHQAVRRLDLLLDRPLRRLSPQDIEEKLVPAARRRLAANRQQLLASMVMMGTNRAAVGMRRQGGIE